MKLLSRVVWNEGMHLTAHHFQAQNRYVEDSVAFALTDLFYKAYGVAASEFDPDALRNGTVSLVHARGVMPDGLAFDFPDGDALPEPREIKELFSPTQPSHLVLLTIPAFQPGQPNCALTDAPPKGPVRYRAEQQTLSDETTGQDEKPVEFARKNFRLILDSEVTDGMVSMPLARVKRDGTGHFIYDPDYVAPCLQIVASRRLMGMLLQVVEMLETKWASLAQERAAAPDADEYAAKEIANFWLAHTIHTAIPPLRHHLTTRSGRPEELFVELSRLAGALCTFSLEADPNALPTYDHDHLDECFNQLFRHLETHLNVVLPTNSVTVPLDRLDRSIFLGQLQDERALGKCDWILGVRAELAQPQLIALVPRLVKVCGGGNQGEFIKKLVQRAHAGIPLEHIPVPPSAVSPRPGMEYFLVNGRAGQDQAEHLCWTLIRKAKDVGIYVPETLPNVELRLQVVLD